LEADFERTSVLLTYRLFVSDVDCPEMKGCRVVTIPRKLTDLLLGRNQHPKSSNASLRTSQETLRWPGCREKSYRSAIPSGSARSDKCLTEWMCMPPRCDHSA